METTPPTSLQTATSLQALDALSVSFALLDENGCPCYLSSEAARLLRLKYRSAPEQYLGLLVPLAEIAQKARQVQDQARNIQRQALTPQSPPAASELNLTAADGTNFLALAYAKIISLAELHGNPRFGLVVFHPVSQFAPFLRLAETFSRVRTLFLLAICSLPSVEDLSSLESTLQLQYLLEESVTTSLRPRSTQGNALSSRPRSSDLLTTLTKAISLIDIFLQPGVRFNFETSQTALVEIPQSMLLKIITHLLLEAADFAGLAGSIQLRSRFLSHRTQDSGTTTNPTQVRLSLHCVGSQEVPISPNPLENHLLRACSPGRHQVNLRGEQLLPSETLRVADYLLQAVRGELRVRKRNNVLCLTAEFPLSDVL